jgi:hypothetical protein
VRIKRGTFCVPRFDQRFSWPPQVDQLLCSVAKFNGDVPFQGVKPRNSTFRRLLAPLMFSGAPWASFLRSWRCGGATDYASRRPMSRWAQDLWLVQMSCPQLLLRPLGLRGQGRCRGGGTVLPSRIIPICPVAHENQRSPRPISRTPPRLPRATRQEYLLGIGTHSFDAPDIMPGIPDNHPSGFP